MQIFYKVPQTPIHSMGSLHLFILAIKELVSGTASEEASEQAFWRQHFAVISVICLIIMQFILAALFQNDEIAVIITLLVLVPLYFAIIWFLGPRQLLYIGLDAESHYLIIARYVDTVWSKLPRPSYIDIHEIKTVSAGCIDFKSGKTVKLAEINGEIAASINQSVTNLLAKSGGNIPVERPKRDIIQDWLND